MNPVAGGRRMPGKRTTATRRRRRRRGRKGRAGESRRGERVLSEQRTSPEADLAIHG